MLSILWTLLVLPIPLLGSLFVLGRPDRKARLGAWAAKLWARGLLRLYRVQVHAQGSRPTPGSFVISNHLSWLDILALASLYPTNFVGKSEINDWAFMGFLSRCGGSIFIDRENRSDTRRVTEILHWFLARNSTITLFPEGWCGNGVELLPFKRSLFAAAAQLKTPCIPTSIHYSRPEVIWSDESHLIRHAKNLFRGGAVVATVHFSPPLTGTNRKTLAMQCETAVQQTFRPSA